MDSAFLVKTHLRTNFSLLLNHQNRQQAAFCKIVCCEKDISSPSSSSSNQKFRFRLLGRTFGDTKWNFSEIDTSAVQDSVSQLLSMTQNFLNEVTSPLVKTVHDKRPSIPNEPRDPGAVQDSVSQLISRTQNFLNGVTSPLAKNVQDKQPSIPNESRDVDEIFLTERSINSNTPNGELSVAAIFSVEQFSRMNGLTGQKMQKIFKAVVPESVYNDARNLVEYCCFRFLSRDSSAIHPSLKEPAFRRLIFVTMLAWQQPYRNQKDSNPKAQERDLLQRSLVEEEAFVHIVPVVSGVADWPTAHNLFKALAGEERGISYSIWSTYIDELLKVHEGRKSCKSQESLQLSRERILGLSSSRKPPVLKWEKNMSWPGKLTLTERALYFEKIDFRGQRDTMRLDLTRDGTHIKKTRVGPWGSDLFDSAVSVTSGSESDTWILEFVDLGGDMRRDVWYASISEVIAVRKFMGEFGPGEEDQSVHCVYGAQKGKDRAITYASNAIARLQSLQFMRRLFDEPMKLVPFSYLQNSPYGDIVCQTLAVNFWGGPLVSKVYQEDKKSGQVTMSVQEASEKSNNVFDIDGSVYLRQWMRSPSWASAASLTFWRSVSVKNGVVLGKNLVVADKTSVQRAAMTFRDKCKIAEKTQETIDAAMIEGIPSNIDLFKELVFPLAIIAQKFEGLRRWEEPVTTASFLLFLYTVIFRNMIRYVFPVTLMMMAAGMLLLKVLKEQGRLGRNFGKVTIRDQPPSNTIQKIIALKQAMREMEIYLQGINVSLLKVRAIVLAGHPQVTTEIALVLMISASVLLVFPFKYIMAFVVFDLFTRELKFREQMVLRFMSLLKERWGSIPAAPVVVLPYEDDKSDAPAQKKQMGNQKALRASDKAE